MRFLDVICTNCSLLLLYNSLLRIVFNSPAVLWISFSFFGLFPVIFHLHIHVCISSMSDRFTLSVTVFLHTSSHTICGQYFQYPSNSYWILTVYEFERVRTLPALSVRLDEVKRLCFRSLTRYIWINTFLRAWKQRCKGWRLVIKITVLMTLNDNGIKSRFFRSFCKKKTATQ